MELKKYLNELGSLLTKEYEAGENELKIIENWVRVGFAENYPKNIRNLALAFEIAAKNIIEKTEELPDQYETIIFPVIRRIFSRCDDEIDLDIEKIKIEVEKIEAAFKNDIKSIEEEAEKAKNELFDAEAELVAKWSEEYNQFAK